MNGLFRLNKNRECVMLNDLDRASEPRSLFILANRDEPNSYVVHENSGGVPPESAASRR